VIDRKINEAAETVSIYLRPEDGKPLPTFKPGQHLIFRFQIPGQSKPVIRCFSLSDAPHSRYYRITVKGLPAPADSVDVPAGLVSSFVNSTLADGDIIDVKAPHGSFFLNEQTETPIVMLAGGIGITPMTSIINTLVANESKRQMLLVYAVRNGEQHPFKKHFASLGRTTPNFKVINFYSKPFPHEKAGRDFDVAGHVDVALLKKILPHQNVDFYLCGPAPFMNSLYHDLIDWGIRDEQVFFEAFGPASVTRKHELSEATSESEMEQPTIQIEFCKSGKTVIWTGQHENLLDLAEENELFVDSGCRSGNCGTCELDLIAGTTCHPDHVVASEGKCLACVAIPKSDLKLDA
jgi:ferredoxin-NADP reductase